MPNDWFRFKQFTIQHGNCAHKVGTDGVLAGAWAYAKDPKYILDIGSGTGVISLMMAQRFPEAQVTGIELDANSYRQSLQNILHSAFAPRVSVIRADFLKHDFARKQFDLIISNPPFFNQAYLSGDTKRDQARHTFSLPHKAMLGKASSLLTKDGAVSLILPAREIPAFEKDIDFSGLHISRKTLIADKPGLPVKRVLLELRQEKTDMEESLLFIRDEKGTFSEVYKKLTGEFYLNF